MKYTHEKWKGEIKKKNSSRQNRLKHQFFEHIINFTFSKKIILFILNGRWFQSKIKKFTCVKYLRD